MEKQHEVGRRQYFLTHRPKLIVREIDILFVKPTLKLRYVVANTGASEGRIVESHAEIQLVNDGHIHPLQPTEGANPIGDVEIAPSLNVWRECDSTFNQFGMFSIAHQKNDGLRGPRRSDPLLLFRGFVIYEDGAKIRRRTAFCRSYDWDRERFITLDDPDYEYAD